MHHFENKIISEILKDFYHDLYSFECKDSSAKRKNFLDKIVFPTLSAESSKDFGRPITAQEVLECMKSLWSGMAPAPDGFGPEFYKKMAKHVVALLTNMYVESFKRGTLAPNFKPCPHFFDFKKGQAS